MKLIFLKKIQNSQFLKAPSPINIGLGTPPLSLISNAELDISLSIRREPHLKTSFADLKKFIKMFLLVYFTGLVKSSLHSLVNWMTPPPINSVIGAPPHSQISNAVLDIRRSLRRDPYLKTSFADLKKFIKLSAVYQYISICSKLIGQLNMSEHVICAPFIN